MSKEQDDLVIYCADIGSVMTKKFGWCRSYKFKFNEGMDIRELCSGIAKDLSDSKKVALGFECPLFVPISENPVLLTSARQGEADRAWSAGAGCGALATGLTECAFILQEIKKDTCIHIEPTFNWGDFYNGNCNLFIWEAFVSKSSKALTHSGDAMVAVRTFLNHFPNITESNSVTAVNPYNLVAAALLRVGLTDNINLLSEPCIVVKS